MKRYAPKYYKRFQCIADRCEHSCCIGWEIDIDGESLKKYRAMTEGYGAVIRDSVCCEGAPHFALGEGDRCPHLDGQGLCRIILYGGEELLCDICREHPRFYNYTSVVEVGLGMSCPEAARIILSSPDYAVLEELGEEEGEPDAVGFDGRSARSELYAILQDRTGDYAAALDAIYGRYGIVAGPDERWRSLLGELEYLDPSHKPLLMKYSSAHRPEGGEGDVWRERFLAYLLYRHTTEAADEDDFCARLSFCLFCERLLASLMDDGRATSLGEVAALASMISEELEYSEENTLALTYGY